MNLDLILAIGAPIVGTSSLLMGYGIIRQKIKPSATKERVALLYRLQKLCGFTMLAIGLLNILEVANVL